MKKRLIIGLTTLIILVVIIVGIYFGLRTNSIYDGPSTSKCDSMSDASIEKWRCYRDLAVDNRDYSIC